MIWRLMMALIGLLPMEEPDPPVTDLERFPPRSVVTSARLLGRAYIQHCRQMAEAELHRSEWWQERAAEGESLYHVWDKLDDAQLLANRDPTYTDETPEELEARCRAHLANLRCLLGRKHYHQGRMPPPVPIWRFTHLD